jgi:hypothetical protein
VKLANKKRGTEGIGWRLEFHSHGVLVGKSSEKLRSNGGQQARKLGWAA